MKSLSSFALAFIFSLPGWASTDWRESAHLVAAYPALQQQLDEVTEELFQSRLKEVFCSIYNNPFSASHALGISQNAAGRIFEGCPKSNRHSMTKVFAKQYYVSFATPSGLDSWTDFGNRTFIFADEFLDRNKLKMIVLHEMAIATDAKTNMLLSTYLVYRNKEHSQITGDRQVISLNNLTPHEESLKQAFNWSTWKPISLSFTTLRAFNMEKFYETGSSDMTHENCVAEFKTVLSTIKGLPTMQTSTGIDEIPEMLADLLSDSNAPRSPDHEAKVLEFLTSPNLRIRDVQGSNISFCQFMSQPLSTGHSLYNFYGSGPRPRLTGGSGGQGGGNLDSQWRKDIEPLPIELQKTTIPSVKLDQLQEAIQKLKEARAIPPKDLGKRD